MTDLPARKAGAEAMTDLVGRLESSAALAKVLLPGVYLEDSLLEAATAIRTLLKERDNRFPLSEVRNSILDERERCARIAETHRRDASFNDSIAGHQEHEANQANIAAAIRAQECEE